MTATLSHHIAPIYDRDAIARRNQRAFKAGDQARRRETARLLRVIAAEIDEGKAPPLVLAGAARLLALRGVK